MKILTAFLLCMIVSPALSVACSCMLPTFEEQFNTATAVFTGRAIRVEPQQEGGLRVALESIRIWKGPHQKTISIQTADNTAACGFPFEANKEYLVFATGEKQFIVGLCSRTMLITDAAEDMQRLEKKTSKKQPRRDPFTEMTGERIQAEKLVPKALNITHAVIVGITKKSDGYVALIRATNNKVYFLKVGDKLHDGVVQNIDNNTVTFRQHHGKRSVQVRKKLRPFPDQ